jgi:WD40 repeat protein
VKVWNTRNGKELLTLEGHRDRVQSVAFSPDGTRRASASEDKTVLVSGTHEWNRQDAEDAKKRKRREIKRMRREGR